MNKSTGGYLKIFFRIANKLQALLFIPMLFQYLTHAIMISLCILEAISVEDYFSSTFSARSNLVLGILNEIFFYSYRGDQIKYGSLMIADLIYQSKWYILNYESPNRMALKDFKMLFNFTTMRSRKPIRIMAGGFTSMSIDTFVSVS